MAYIGLDIGTSGCKAAVVTNDARILAMANREYPLTMPENGYAELAPQLIWQKVREVLMDLSPFCTDVSGLALSGIGESFVLLDQWDRPLYNFITYLDQRGDEVTNMIRRKIDEKHLYDITGLKLNKVYTLGRILWFRERMPELFQQAKSLLLFNDYFNFLMTGERAVDYGTASKTMLFDINRHEWSDELLSFFEIPGSLLSPVRETGTPVGQIKHELCNELQLPQGITVFLGCHDQIAANLGAGAFQPGNIMIGEGSSESINLVADISILSEKNKDRLLSKQICIEPFLTKDKYIVPVGLLAFGTSLKWYVNTFEQDTISRAQSEGLSVYAYLDRCCAERTELIFLPYLSKTNLMSTAGCPLGAFIGLCISVDRPELYRAVLEGLHFESRRNFELLKELGLSLNSIVVTGGLSKSALAMQIKADIFQEPINILETSEAGLIGLSIICAVALGDYKDYPAAVEVFVKHKDCLYPQSDYASRYRSYCIASDCIKKLYSDIGDWGSLEEGLFMRL